MLLELLYGVLVDGVDHVEHFEALLLLLEFVDEGRRLNLLLGLATVTW